jgi:hypothetical protein
MCFSAGASFGAGIVLSTLSVITLQKAKGTDKIMFAAIPLLFAIQQIVEGIVWLSLIDPAYLYWRQTATYIYLFFAQVMWPIWVPIAMLRMEKQRTRIRILWALSVIGVLTSVCLAYCLWAYDVQAAVRGRHIAYDIDFPTALASYGGIFYILVTIAPPFFSSIKKMWTVGLTILLSYLFTKLYFAEYIISVWCFFAAIISVVVYFILREIQESISESERHSILWE